MAERTAISVELVRGLSSAVEGEVRPGLHDRMLYATDASLYQVEPLAVVIPASPEDAARAVEFCFEHRLPMLPRGGGTSLAGQCTNRAVVIDMSARCTRLLELDTAGRRCRVEPGITIDELNDAIGASGLFFAPDPATSRQANIGGCIGNNAAGSRSIMYGRTSENLIAVDVCLADGERLRLEEGAAGRDERAGALTRRVAEVVWSNAELIRERYPKTIRRNAGYALDLILQQLDEDPGDLSRVNLAKLMCGSEGTLGVTLGAELSLRAIPKARGLAVAAFASVDAAMEALLPLLELGPSAVELLDDLVIGLARAQTEYRRYVELLPQPGGVSPEAVLYVEFSSESGGAEIEGCFDRVKRLVGADRVACHTDVSAMMSAWKLRKAGEPLLHGVPGDRKPITFVEDNAIPPERLGEFVRRFRAIVSKHGTRAAFYAHASVGVLHARPLLNIKDAGDRVRMQEIAAEVSELARELGGVMSGEHGDGRVRGPFVERYFGPELMRAFGEIKAIFDPENLLNPGMEVESAPIESMASRLRVRPADVDVRVPEVETFYDYSDQHGFGSAVEMCNGAGVCRKKGGGTMCPSYMATLDERHSTRGRGNALRLAITGQLGRLGEAAWGDEETLATLDLCLSCKACKTECPSNVDIARLKSEYLAQSDRAGHGPTLARRAFGHIHMLNRVCGVAPGVANGIANTGLARVLSERVLGIDRRRSLPRFEKPLHRRWAASGADRELERPRVMLLADTFTCFNEPRIGLAARAVLEAFGYRVSLYMGTDFGRALISQGLLAEAIRDAEGHLDRLRSDIEDEGTVAFLFCEPSCLSSVVDDWRSLRIGRSAELCERLAARSFAVEDFLYAHWERHPVRPPFMYPGSEPILYHGHCHQKALWSESASVGLLERCLERAVVRLETGCCGMAGAFGFSREHFDVSNEIASLALLPQIDTHPPEAVIVAPGTSCRHQILDARGRHALHPMEVVCGALVRL